MEDVIDNVSFSDICLIRNKYENWDHAIRMLSNRNRISPNAIKLAEKLKTQLDIYVFPSIMITAIKGWTSQGCANFCINCESYFFFDKPAKYLSKKVKLVETDGGCDGTEIYYDNI